MANPRTIARIAERIRERAAHVLLSELQDPRASFITVTRVEMASDLLSGKIYYSVLGSEGDRSKAEHMLGSAQGWIQRQIAPVLDLRRMPHLSWHYDESIARAADLDALIREARARDEQIRGATSAGEDALAEDAPAAADEAADEVAGADPD